MKHRSESRPTREPSPQAPDSTIACSDLGIGDLGRRRRVLFLDHTAALGGGELAMFNLVRTLDARRFLPVVVLFSDGPLALKLRDAGIETHVLPLAPAVVNQRKDTLGGSALLRFVDVAAVAAYAFRLANFMTDRRIDIVHTNSLKADIIGGLGARVARVPLVWHVRDRIADDYLPRSVVWAFRLLCRVIPQYVIANSAATLGTLHLPRGDQGSAIPSGIEIDARMRVVHDGAVDADATGAVVRSVGRPRIALLGRITRWKGHHIFLEAAARVRESYPDARFEIIGAALFGEDEYAREVRTLSVELGLESAVEFRGFSSDVVHALANVDILVHASIVGEPFGQVVIEGMAAGKPVVATRGGGIPEIVIDGVTGLLVPMGDAAAMASAILRLLADPAMAAEMARLGRQRVLDHFTIERAARAVERIYLDVLARHRRSPWLRR